DPRLPPRAGSDQDSEAARPYDLGGERVGYQRSARHQQGTRDHTLTPGANAKLLPRSGNPGADSGVSSQTRDVEPNESGRCRPSAQTVTLGRERDATRF